MKAPITTRYVTEVMIKWLLERGDQTSHHPVSCLSIGTDTRGSKTQQSVSQWRDFDGHTGTHQEAEERQVSSNEYCACVSIAPLPKVVCLLESCSDGSG
jgi:hypothetical protein